MLLLLTCMLAAAAAAPHYDQRQEGELNVQADVQNVVLLILRPKKVSPSFLDFFSNKKKQVQEEAEDRADVQAMEAFVEANEPYKVEIGSEGKRRTEADTAEVVIAGRRRLDSEPPEQDEYKLLGATEQCGPGRVRDPETLTCRAADSSPPAAPAQVPPLPPSL